MKREDVLKVFNPLVEGDVKHYPTGAGARIKVTPDMVTLRPRSGAQLLQMEKAGTQNLAKFVGLPLHIARMISPKTFGDCLSELLEQKGAYSVVLKDDKVTNFIPLGTKNTVHPEKLMDIVEKTIPLRDYYRAMVMDQTCTLEVAGERILPVKRGDLVQAGVRIIFSPMGITSPIVQTFGVRCECTNGITSNHVLNEYHGNGGGGGSSGGSSGDKNVWNFFRQSIKKAYNSFDGAVNEWKNLSDEEVGAGMRASMLEALIRRAQLPPEIGDAVRAMAIDNPPRTAWDMLNLITYASSHLLSIPKQITRAQQAAADFATEGDHAKSCPMCHAQRGGTPKQAPTPAPAQAS